MRNWTGMNVCQWEHSRRWEIAAGLGEFVRAEGALLLPGFVSLSVFFRRASQTASTVELVLWTAPIYFRPLDEDNFSNNPAQYLLPLVVEPATGLQMTGTGAQVFGARIAPAQAMGSLLFWQLKNTGGSTAIVVGDIYVVPNHQGTMTLTDVRRTVDLGGGPGMGNGARPMMRQG